MLVVAFVSFSLFQYVGDPVLAMLGQDATPEQRADLRRDLAAAGIVRADGVAEPEDHIAFLCEVMHGQILGLYAEPAALAAQRAFFDKHIEPWAARFFADLEAATAAAFYRPVGTLGRSFLAIEREGFGYLD